MLVPKGALAVVACASTDATRYTLNGVYLERRNGHSRAVATDGRRLMEATWKTLDPAESPEGYKGDHRGKSWRAIVPTSAVVSAVKAVPKKPLLPIMGNVWVQETAKPEDGLTVTSGDIGDCHAVTTQAVDGHFPDVDQVTAIDKRCKPFRVCVNAVYLKEMCAAIEKMGTEHVIIEGYDGLKPLHLYASSLQTGLRVHSLLMPVDMDDSACWWRQSPEKAETKPEPVPEDETPSPATVAEHADAGIRNETDEPVAATEGSK